MPPKHQKTVAPLWWKEHASPTRTYGSAMYRAIKEIIRKCWHTSAAVGLNVIFNQGFLSCNDAERWGGDDRGCLRCRSLNGFSAAWLITEADSKRIAAGNKDTSVSAVSPSEGPIRQMDVYWQARDSQSEVWKDEVGEDRRAERKRCGVTHLGTGCNVSRPGGHHSAALSGVLFKGKQISGSECHRKDTRGLISTNQCPRFQITFSPSLANKSIFLIAVPCFTPPFDPWRPRWGGGAWQQIYDPHRLAPGTIYWH